MSGVLRAAPGTDHVLGPGQAAVPVAVVGVHGHGGSHLRTVAAAVVERVHAPPAMVFLHELHFQMPTAWRFTESCIQPIHQETFILPTKRCAKANLAAESTGVACVLSDLHLDEKHVNTTEERKRRGKHTFLTGLRREAP